MRSLATLGALLLGASLSHAGAAEDCNQVRDLNRQLRGCTAFIEQGRASPENLATAHLNRANIHARRRNYALAFADYASAIALDPRNPLIPYNRGNAYLDARRYELAVADYSRALELDAGFALAYLIAREKLGTCGRGRGTTGGHLLSTRRLAPRKEGSSVCSRSDRQPQEDRLRLLTDILSNGFTRAGR